MAEHSSYIHPIIIKRMKKEMKFTDSLVFKILAERWRGKDMEKYFIDKNKAFIKKLKKELKIK